MHNSSQIFKYINFEMHIIQKWQSSKKYFENMHQNCPLNNICINVSEAMLQK
jgi:hypothetical protein